MTLPDVLALNAYWRGNPPVHIAVARYLGIKPGRSAVAEGEDVNQVSPAELEQAFGPARPFVPPIPIRRA